jgi:hypothetical protein
VVLSEYEQKTVWDGMLGAEIRAQYFAELSVRYQARQRWLVLGTLVLTSGAFLSLVTTAVPAPLGWVKPLLVLLAAILSACSLAATNERNSIESADLHFRWNMLALDFQHLWADIYEDQARARLREVQERDAILSKSSTAFPDDETLMLKCQDHVEMNHRSELTAGQGVVA